MAYGFNMGQSFFILMISFHSGAAAVSGYRSRLPPVLVRERRAFFPYKNIGRDL